MADSSAPWRRFPVERAPSHPRRLRAFLPRDRPHGGSPIRGPRTGPCPPAAPAGTAVAQLILHPAAPVNRFQEKAAFSAATGIYDLATPAVPSADAVGRGDVIDLTSRMHPDGTLDWTPPPGRWVILRMGYSLTGAHNSPASPEATGLEVDKMNRAYVENYFDNYLGQYKDTVGPLMGKRGCNT